MKALLLVIAQKLLNVIPIFSVICILEILAIAPAYPQSATSNQTSNVGNDASFNQILQSSPQVPVNNNNTINYPNIFPLNNVPNAFVNTENDFGFNLSAGVNTLDTANLTIYVGIIYQPGRTEDHNIRMTRLRKETELLETQKKTMEANLTLLQKQIDEATIRLQRLQQPIQNN
ncbi:hypothetical protein WKK05_07210 [Nostoc sp. UHCC 0302]|uniref:hypothetical protein n=1 Tax=Nostoc sp. UHCC 0302 TaxID=3134896 RepID=UPI00311CAC09